MDPIIWVEEIDSRDKARIEEVVKNLSNMTPDYSGGFSDIYVVGDYAIKRTFYNHVDDTIDHPDADLDTEGYPIECILQSDKYLLSQMRGHNNFPVLYGYTGDLEPENDCVHEDVVIMDFLKGPSLDDLLMHNTRDQKDNILSRLEKPIKKVLADIIYAGWYPVDFRFRCVYPHEKDGFKLIDYNLYQSIEYMKMNDSVIDFSDPKKLANKIWECVVDYELCRAVPLFWAG